MKEKTIDYVLRATWQAISKMYNEEVSTLDTTMATSFTLLSIDPKKGTPSTALGPKMGMGATSLSRILKNMERARLIVRKPNPADGRSILVHLTTMGRAKRDASKNIVLHFNNAVKAHLSQTQLDHFFEVTETINMLISEKKIYPNKTVPHYYKKSNLL